MWSVALATSSGHQPSLAQPFGICVQLRLEVLGAGLCASHSGQVHECCLYQCIVVGSSLGLANGVECGTCYRLRPPTLASQPFGICVQLRLEVLGLVCVPAILASA
jgi:hypothetical protein